MGRYSDWLLHPLRTLRHFQAQQKADQLQRLRSRYQVFRALLDDNHRAVELLTELGSALRSPLVWQRTLVRRTEELIETSADLVEKLEQLTNGVSAGLTHRQINLAKRIRQDLAQLPSSERLPFCLPLDKVSNAMLSSVGGKAASLARLRSAAMFHVPDGFVVPVSACRLFLEIDDLYLQVVSRLRGGRQDAAGMPERETVESVQQLIINTPLPVHLSEALAAAAAPLFAKGRGIAVRSSAVGEDSAAHSFAGQYVSVLNVVTLPQLEQAFKTVVASSFNSRNLAYRRHGGMSPYDFELAILCLEMVDVRAAGILFTVDPNFRGSGTMLITAVHGLGELAVGGSAAADVYRPPRDGSGGGLRQVAHKSRRLVSGGAGGVYEEALSAEAGLAPVLTEAESCQLVQLGREAEDLLGGPLDIEWAVDAAGRVVLLQARPLKVAAAGGAARPGSAGRQALLTGGLVAAPGRGGGRVRVVGTSKDLEGLTEPPYVFVMHQSLVEAVGALRQVGALLVDLGNPADHLSCVAREYEIPMLTGLGCATAELKDGEAVLVDGDRGMVFKALDAELVNFRKLHQKKAARWKERVALPQDPVSAALYNRIVPLNLTDAYGPTFTIAECKTIHDLVRYAHEKAVLAMFEAGDEAVEKSSGVISHLDSDIPFHFSIIDLGGGLLAGSGRRVVVDQVVSRPFRALWQGVLTPGLVWGPAAGGVAVGPVMSRFMSDHRSARPIGLPNYALVTRDFLNINARMDFHFTMVDTICGNDDRLNYVKFRFKGGGTSLEQRCRRVSCLAEILAAAGFFCDLRDDLLTASIQGGGGQILEEKLMVIGRILGFSRLLDAAMQSDDLISKVACAFMEGDYQLESLAEEFAQ